MCGIAGFLAHTVAIPAITLLESMGQALVHRGPDNSGVWHDPSAGIGLVHRRLAILDLSPAGHQPMHSACGRYVLAFNGEIYNHAELRVELASTGLAPPWRGHSDTEVLLASMAVWGVVATLKRTRGMFALALWDREQRELCLARDRIGEKPLYYGRVAGCFAFASELKALRAWPGATFSTDPAALALFLRYGYVPSPHSIYRDVFKLPPGTILRVAADGRHGDPEPWWRFDEVVQAGVADPLDLSDCEAVAELERLLGAAVGEQMMAEVPLGALLSGGLDSSTVVALMQAQCRRPVRTFTIGFAESDYDEAIHARAVARHLGTAHTELQVTPRDALEVIPRLADIYDEPFADASQIPTTLVCALTRQHVTVCLSGDAGDELLAGYNRYVWTRALWRRLGPLSAGLRRGLASGLLALPAGVWGRLFGILSPVMPDRLRLKNPGDKLHKLARVMGTVSAEVLYCDLMSQWHGPLPLRGVHEPASLIAEERRWPQAPTLIDRLMALDTVTYLPDDILVKVDRAAMAASLETRVPLLDPRLIEFAWRLPLRHKVRDGQGKWLLRQVLYRHVPRELVERPKQGFSVPLEHWLRGPLRDWAENLLSSSALSADGLLDPAPIRDLWRQHLAGSNLQHALWCVLMYQSWRLRWE
jgi:asparagine synthase (glutamine-hydrolysing)